MPKVNSYTPAWLSKPNPGYEIFTPTASTSQSWIPGEKKNVLKPGPRRAIARRGTSEFFVAVGKEIRWADLVYMKEVWEDKQDRQKHPRRRRESATQYEAEQAQGYRTIKTPVADDIRQLIISPNSNYLAILTTHTVHIAILPEYSYLTSKDTGPMRLKTYTLGPTTHVTSQSAIASALWHPLGVNGTCLVTVTEDALVRVWELSTADRWSFDRPTLSIDLKRLADGTSLDQDFSAPVAGKSKGFSPDSFEMEVASACFPSRGSDGWSPMTLWVAMREGDVYALCPLLPDKWSPPPMLIPSLSVSIVANLAATEDDPDVPKKSKLLSQQQMAWMADIDDQVPLHSEDSVGEGPGDVYLRPSKPGRVPRLQGPFEFELAPEESEDELDTLISDIFVIGAKIDAEGLMLGEENELEIDEDQEGLSMGVVCLLTSSGRLSICLDVDGVEAQWLPKNKAKFSGFVEDSDPPSLLTFQVLDTSRDGEVWKGNWPMFSHDVYSRYSFYITDTSSITFISLTPWVSRLEAELNQGGAGTDFRLDLLAKGQNSIRERVFTQKMDDHSTPLSASELIRDPDLGYMLVAATPYAPIAVSFELPEFEDDLVRRSRSPTYDLEPDKPLVLVEPRPVYQPAHILEEESGLPQFLERLRHSKYKRLLQEDVRLSPATLTIMTEIHQELSEETHRLGTAAAELFRKCDQLQIELRNQISKANDVAARVEQITGDDLTDGPALSSGQIIEERIRAVNNKQQEITARLEKIRKQATKGTRRELSDKEKLWIEEVNEMERKLIGSNNGENSQGRAKEVWTRYEQAQHLKDDLLEQIKGLSIEDEPLNSPNVKVPSEIRRAKLAQVMSLLDRETALVEGAKSRLERLGVA